MELLYTNTVEHKIFFYLMYYTVQLCVMSITGRTSQFLGYLPAHCQTFNSLVNTAEDRLLSSVIRNSYHVLRPLFPPILTRRPGLRKRVHPFTLPIKGDKQCIPRVLL